MAESRIAAAVHGARLVPYASAMSVLDVGGPCIAITALLAWFNHKFVRLLLMIGVMGLASQPRCCCANWMPSASAWT